MTIKSALSSVGNGLLTATAVIHNSSNLTRMSEIDEQIAQLQEERDRLENDLIKY